MAVSEAGDSEMAIAAEHGIDVVVYVFTEEWHLLALSFIAGWIQRTGRIRSRFSRLLLGP